MPGHSSSSHSSSSHSSSSHSHSSSSHSSHSRPHFSSTPTRRVHESRPTYSSHSSTTSGYKLDRPMTNQPQGYTGTAPMRYYGLNHNYTYYSNSWTDPETGKKYCKGFYDESGKYYADVAFKRDGKYEKVIAKCPYCDSKRRVDWVEGEELTCLSCGAPMEVITALDTSTSSVDMLPSVPAPAPNQPANNSYVTAMVQGTTCAVKIIKIVMVIIFLAIFSIPIIGVISHIPVSVNSSSSASNGSNSLASSNVEIFGTTLYLQKVDNKTYEIGATKDNYDKKLTWDYGEDSYYDAESQCFLWYNTDVAPNIWQYYYVGISDKYSNNCGWMEYEPTGWYIETTPGNWQKYTGDTSKFWHLTIDVKDFE